MIPLREHQVFNISDSFGIKKGLLEWSRKYTAVVWLDSNNHQDRYSSFDALLAIGQTDESTEFIDSIVDLGDFIDQKQDWLFGYISYDLKNDLEDLESQNFDGLEFPTIQFFSPLKLIILKDGKLHFHYLKSQVKDLEKDYAQISDKSKISSLKRSNPVTPKIQMRIHKDSYFEKVDKLLEHIHRGDVYEANFCQEFYTKETTLDPWETYHRLNQISQPPFASFIRMGEQYMMCASPERYLKKVGEKVISQPIKGTARRGQSQKEDGLLKVALAQDEKERAENIMIADLVRNDLSKSALKGTVQVEELCKVYSYKQVHQMISTITSKVSEGKKPLELIKETFPMGSMTGAPKISAMKIIEGLEETKRGLYSGSVGYFAPNGDFDFNVVIRSILYDALKEYVSFSVGSAITSKSISEKEYQECLLKAKAMRSVLEQG